MIADAGKGGEGTRQLREKLLAGIGVEVGGYMIAPALASGLDGATLTPPRGAGRLAWLEVSSAGADVLPASQVVIQGWRDAEWEVDAAVVEGPPFRQTQEIAEVSGLVAATIAMCESLCV